MERSKPCFEPASPASGLLTLQTYLSSEHLRIKKNADTLKRVSACKILCETEVSFQTPFSEEY